MSTSITLRSPEAAIASVPYLMGFTPTRSLVTIGITTDADGHRQVGLVSRTDLPDPGTTDLSAYAKDVVEPFSRNGIDTAVVFAIVDDADPVAAISEQGAAPWADLSYELDEVGGRAFTEVMDVLYTDNTSYTSYLCDSTGCPCANGAQITQAVRDQVAAEFIAVGVSPAASREELAREWTVSGVDAEWKLLTEGICADVAPGGPGYRPVEGPAQLMEQYGHLGSVIDQMATEQGVNSSVIIALARANSNVQLRDALLHHVGSRTAAQARDIATTARTIAVMMPAEHREAAAVLSSVGQFLAGDGVRAGFAADQALAVNPQSTMAQYMQVATAAGLAPSVYRAGLQDMTPQQVMGIAPLHAAAAAAAPPAPAPAVAR